MLGRPLNKGEDSVTGLYGIVSSMTGRPLRVSLDKETADILADGHHRTIAEAYLVSRSGSSKAEQPPSNRNVAGSSPVRSANLDLTLGH